MGSRSKRRRKSPSHVGPRVSSGHSYVGPSFSSGKSHVGPTFRSGNPTARLWPYLALLVAAALLTFANSFNNTFVHDDVGMPTTAALEHVSTTWKATYVRPGAPFTGRPVVALSLTLNHAANGFDPRGYHTVTVSVA